jgi:hypothetical protein
VKQRFVGRVNGDNYEVLNPDGGVGKVMTLAEARTDTKLAAAIERNGWEAVPEE